MRPWSIVCWLVFVLAGCSVGAKGCDDGSQQAEDIDADAVTPDAPSVDLPFERAEVTQLDVGAFAPEEVWPEVSIEDLVVSPDAVTSPEVVVLEEEPPYCDSPCEEGDLECKYNGKAYRLCILGEASGCWNWDKVHQCDGYMECIQGQGCTCISGPCSEDNTSACVGELEACEMWGCGSGCCVVATYEPPDCCISSDDCEDGDPTTGHACVDGKCKQMY